MDESTKRTTQSDDEITISLDNLWPAIKKRVWVAVVTALLVTVAQYVYATITFHPIYRTSSTFTVSVSNNYGTSTKIYNNKTAKQMAVTFPYVLQSGVLSDLVASELGYEALPGSVSATALEETNLFTLTVTAADPQLAYDIMQSVIKNYPKVAEFVVGPTALTLLDEDGVVSEPANAVSWRTALKWGGIAGLVVGAIAVVLYMILHRTVRRVEDLKEISNAKCLAVVPRVTQKRRSRARSNVLITQRKISRGFVESIYRVRMGVENSGARVILMTSSLPGEGKTTVSVNLALSLAKKGNRVILVDCDLRHPTVGVQMGVPERLTKVGLSDYLRGTVSMDGLGFTVSNVNNLVVIPAGKVVKNASELLGKKKLGELIKEMREQADYVILDSPPCSVLADATVTARHADGVLYVVRQDYASCDRVLRGMSNVATSGKPLLGCVLNDATYSLIGSGYGGYYYGRYGYSRYGKGYYGSTKE